MFLQVICKNLYLNNYRGLYLVDLRGTINFTSTQDRTETRSSTPSVYSSGGWTTGVCPGLYLSTDDPLLKSNKSLRPSKVEYKDGIEEGRDELHVSRKTYSEEDGEDYSL